MSKFSLLNPFKARMGKLAKLLILSTIVFSFACSSAPPPRSASDTTVTIPTSGGTRPMANQKTISEALDVPLTKLDGGAFKLTDFKGKVLVVDFWATYCGPCVKQVPQLAELSKRYSQQGLEVIGLTFDNQSDQEKVVEFIKKAGAGYTIGYANDWVSGAFLKGTEDETGSAPIPQLFVISRDGRVVEHLKGANPQHGLPYLEKVVAQELSLNAASR